MIAQLLDWAYPSKCALCGEFGKPFICPVCRSEMTPLDEDAWPQLADLDAVRSVHPYTGRAAQAVRRLKYDRVLTHAAIMADELAVRIAPFMETFDAVIPVPIHWSRKCLRGFNQAEVLSGSLPRVRHDVLVRTRRTRQQVGLTPEQRLHNLRGAFSVNEPLVGLTVLLVDDVVTSGGTARECARALRSGGAARVELLTYCAGGSMSDL